MPRLGVGKVLSQVFSERRAGTEFVGKVLGFLVDGVSPNGTGADDSQAQTDYRGPSRNPSTHSEPPFANAGTEYPPYAAILTHAWL